MKHLLQAIIDDRSNLDLHGCSDRLVRHAVDVGLGPALYRATRDGGRGPWSEVLRAQDLAARVDCLTRLDALEEILTTAPRDLTQEILLLKGVSLCQRVYPEAHLRMMGDVDLLVPAALQGGLETVLHGLGYVQRSLQRPEFYARHHHSMPFVHPRTGLVVEVHTGLFPPASALGAVGWFGPESILRRRVAQEFRGFRLHRLDDPTELAYLAAHWINERRCFGAAIIPILDIGRLVRQLPAGFDWEQVFRGIQESAAAVPLRLALGFIDRRIGVRLPRAVGQRLMRLGSRPSAGVDPLLHGMIERYAVNALPFGRFLTRNIATNIWDTLMVPRPGWVNILSLPWRLLFPPGHPRRYDPRFQWRRLASAMMRRANTHSRPDR